MSEKTKSKKQKNRQTYRPKENAVHVTLYDPTGETLSESARHEAEDALLQVAIEHKLLLSIATT